jgi:activating signal cointegrator complex subunit 2
MAPDIPKTLPPLAPFPEATWRGHLLPDEWSACLNDWISLAEAYLLFSVSDPKILLQDETLVTFLSSFVRELALVSPDIPSLGDPERIRRLRKDAFLLTSRLMDIEPPPDGLLKWEFLVDLSKAYGKTHSNKIMSGVWTHFPSKIEPALSTLKTTLIKELDAGLKGRPEILEKKLARLNHLLHASPETAAFFLSGADFLDGLVSCYKLMNPPLRKAIIATAYLCLIGLTEGFKPNFSLLRDQLYSLKSAAEAHKAGPTNVNDSMVAELITGTPILKQIQERIDNNGTNPGMAKQVLASLEGFRKPGGSQRPKKLVRRKIDKGKDKAIAETEEYGHGTAGQIHVHRMSLIFQVQDLFPDLGSGFIVKLLDEYNDNVEEVISHLLEDSLPSYLENSDRSEQL